MNPSPLQATRSSGSGIAGGRDFLFKLVLLLPCIIGGHRRRSGHLLCRWVVSPMATDGENSYLES